MFKRKKKQTGPIVLSPEDFSQWQVRRRTVEVTALTSSMVQESYRAWTEDVKKRYGIRGTFDIHPETGEVKLRR